MAKVNLRHGKKLTKPIIKVPRQIMNTDKPRHDSNSDTMIPVNVEVDVSKEDFVDHDDKH